VYQANAIEVLTISASRTTRVVASRTTRVVASRITHVIAFLDPALFPAFGLPAALPTAGAAPTSRH
jgi:hypothetical protein